MGAAVAVIVVREKHIVEAFLRAGATSAAAAATPEAIGVSENRAFDRLRTRAVLREAGPGTFYLDEASWQALRAMRRRLGLAAVLLVVLTAVVTWVRAL